MYKRAVILAGGLGLITWSVSLKKYAGVLKFKTALRTNAALTFEYLGFIKHIYLRPIQQPKSALQYESEK